MIFHAPRFGPSSHNIIRKVCHSAGRWYDLTHRGENANPPVCDARTMALFFLAAAAFAGFIIFFQVP